MYIYHFDDIYPTLFQNETKQMFPQRIIKFVQLSYQVPNDIPEEDMFYNRTYLNYVSSGQFSKKRRMGYLHMCKFSSNFWNYPGTEFHLYDYALQMDDDALLVGTIPEDPLREMHEKQSLFGSTNITPPVPYGTHQGVMDTRENLSQFTKDFCRNNRIVPKQGWLRRFVEEDLDDVYFHNNLPNYDSNVYNLSLFQWEDVKIWVNAVNEYGGQYRHRWGDNELTTLIHELFVDAPVLDFGFVSQGLCNPGGLRYIQGKAPTTKK